MSSSLDRFNWIARHYDFLKGVIFGRAVYESEVSFLGSIPSGGKVLILGGGSGEILPLLLETNPDCHVCFVEASSEMLRLARERLPYGYQHRVEFAHGTEDIVRGEKPVDAVITNFFLDLFPGQRLDHICALLTRRLRREGVWLVSDFVSSKKMRHRFLLWLMYRFFALTTRVQAMRLPAWEDHIRAGGMEEVSSRMFYDGFIKSVLYRKNSYPGAVGEY